MLYRILTQKVDKFSEVIIRACVAKSFNGFTILEGTGYWNGIEEDCLIVEIATIGDFEADVEVEAVAKDIKHRLKQEAIMVQIINCDCDYILV